MKKYFSSYWIRSAFYSFLQRFSITIFGFINFFLLTRSLSQYELGIWGLFLIITGIFEAAKSNLLKNAHIKYVSISTDHHEKIVIASSSFLINAVISLLFILLILFFSNWVSGWFHTGPELSNMLWWFIPGLIFMIFFAHLEAIQQSHLDFKGGFAGYFVRQVSFFGVILAYKVLNRPISLSTLAMYQSFTTGLGTIVLYFFTRKYLAFEFKATMAWVKKIVQYGGYIFGSGMVATITASVDQFMIARLLHPGSAAYYNVAARINLLVDIPSFAASEILFPKASRASVEEGKEKVKYLFEKMVAVLIAFTIPVAIVIISFPRIITVIIAGPAYVAAATILQLYMITGIIRPVQNQAANLLNSIGKTRLVFNMNLVLLVLLVVINYILLKQIGFYGAALGTLTANMISFALWYVIMKKEIDLNVKTIFSYTLDTYKLLFRKAKGFLVKPQRVQSL